MAYTVQQINASLKLYDKIKKVVPTVRQLGYQAVHTLYEWISQFKDVPSIILLPFVKWKDFF